MFSLGPVVELVHRRNVNRLTEGDHAEVSLLLTDPAQIERVIGPGFQFLQSATLIPALHAIDHILHTEPKTQTGDFNLNRLSVIWEFGQVAADNLRGFARLQSFRDGQASFAIRGRDSGRLLYHGTASYGESCSSTSLNTSHATGPVFHVKSAPESIQVGAQGAVELIFQVSARVSLTAPFGHGLRIVGDREWDALPGVRRFTIAADRPHEVNLGKPWLLRVHAESTIAYQALEIMIRVPDANPGKIFYVLTEDCETFDGGPLTGNYGEAAILGNHNNVMDPEDYRIQMIEKPRRMNTIAERHDACWTHFWAVHQRFAAEWARVQSVTTEWSAVVDALDKSIREGAAHHEYAPHLHCDYEPDSTLPPQPRLIYDTATDGILPNEYYEPVLNPTHKHHDWDGAARGGPGIKELGCLENINTKAGSLFKGLHHLARLQAQSGPLLCARTGSFDFGATPSDQEISTRAYELACLRGNSDARFAADQPMPGGHLFWCRRDNHLQRISDLREASPVQLAVTRDVSFERLDDVNSWFEKHWPSCRGAGVHALVIMTHAMFMRGSPDPFRSLEGGAFDILDRHLAWVREHYPDVEFATASEVVAEFLDYYTPTLIGVVDPRLVDGEPDKGRFVFSVRLLGRGIFVGPNDAVELRLQAPSCFHPTDIRSVCVRAGTDILGQAEDFRIGVTLRSRDLPVTLEVIVREHANAVVQEVFRGSNKKCSFHDVPEHREPDLFQLRRPIQNCYTLDAVRLLIHPIAGRKQQERIRCLPDVLMIAALLEATRKNRAGSSRVEFDVTFQARVLDKDFSLSVEEVSDRVIIAARATSGETLARANVRYPDEKTDQPTAESGFWPKLRKRFGRTQTAK